MEEEHEPKTEEIPEAAEIKEELNNSEPTEVLVSVGNQEIIEEEKMEKNHERVEEKNKKNQNIMEEKNDKTQDMTDEKNKKVSEKGKQPAQKMATNGIKKTKK